MTIEFGNERIIAVARQPLKGGGWVALHEDITQRRRQEQEITHLARHDVLTNLANRALFREQLQQALLRLRRGQGFAVFCLDLDRFKAVNDTLGHPVGDVLLKQVSERLLSCVRQGDLVARLGGDEFAIIQANVRDIDSTEALAARIVETIGKPYEINGHRIDISTSIGMTLAPRDGTDADQLMKNADLALYRTKADGRNGYSFFKPEMNDHIQVRRKLETDLREALEKEELELFYQPIVCLETRQGDRLRRPDALDAPRARHDPAGRVHRAGRGDRAGLGARRVGPAAGLRAGGALVLAGQGGDQPLAAADQARPDRGGAAGAGRLRACPRTVSSWRSPNRCCCRTARTRSPRCISCASSACASSWTISAAAIARSATCAASPSTRSRSTARSSPTWTAARRRARWCEAIVGLGNSLGMVTVAEGVENFAQLEMVRGFGCAEAQGYYFSPAVAPGEVERLLNDTFEHARDAA